MASQIIRLNDNSGCSISDDVALKLRRFAGLTLAELCKDNPRLLVFPQCLGINGDKIGEERLFSISGGRLLVENAVGFWGVDDIHIQVHSRFDTGERQFFFHYMLQRVIGINVLDMNTMPDPDAIWDFLIYLFPLALKRAVSQGVFRTYREFKFDDDRLRGHVDVSRFIRRDIPFAGRISYSTREHTGNNHVIQLARHAIEFIRRRRPMLLSVDTEMREAVETIVRLTPDYAERDRSRVVSLNLRPVRHPFYSAYTALQRICLQILRNERITFGTSDGSICGMVFDAAWIWEEYLATIFANNEATSEIIHPRNKKRENPVCFIKPHRSPHYPDFYDERRKAVLDAKYKHLDAGIGNDDLFQLISYLHVLKFGHGLLLFPALKTEHQASGELNGFGGDLARMSLAVPTYTSSQPLTFHGFSRMMGENERDFLAILENHYPVQLSKEDCFVSTSP